MADNETRVTPENTAGDLRSAEEIANASHLHDVRIPKDEAGDEEAATDAAVESVKLPKSLKETLALLADGQAYSPKDKADAKRKVAMLEKLRGHAHALSQAPACKPISGAGHAKLASVSSSHAEEIHLTLLRRTDRIVDARLKADAALIESLQAELKKLSEPPKK